MRRLLVDQIRRDGLLFPGWTWSWIIWSNVLSGAWAPSWAPALSLLALSVAGGPMRLEMHRGLKPIALLPISRREVWRTRWIIGVVFPATISLLGKGIAIGLAWLFDRALPTSALLELMAVSTVYDLVFLCL